MFLCTENRQNPLLCWTPLGYFDDPKMAVVQTPQDFYSPDSFEHDRNRSWFWRDRRKVPFNEQRLFYCGIQPGKNRRGAAFWCGTNALVRMTALREVGGVADESVRCQALRYPEPGPVSGCSRRMICMAPVPERTRWV